MHDQATICKIRMIRCPNISSESDYKKVNPNYYKGFPFVLYAQATHEI